MGKRHFDKRVLTRFCHLLSNLNTLNQHIYNCDWLSEAERPCSLKIMTLLIKDILKEENKKFVDPLGFGILVETLGRMKRYQASQKGQQEQIMELLALVLEEMGDLQESNLFKVRNLAMITSGIGTLFSDRAQVQWAPLIAIEAMKTASLSLTT
mmetsp:Transcript_5376/g.9024  ORF Transcript_5376/g.9024 Transcript_5376/m.9024 type:complete len:154 (+) Transcript_5376:662-1123(+)